MAVVSDVMTTALITVPHDAEVDVAIELMVTKKVSAVAVVDTQGTLLGVISEYDVLQLLGQADNPGARLEPCAKYMTSPAKSISPHASLDVVANVFRAAATRRLFVVDNEKLIGIISRRDILRYIRDHRHAPPVPQATRAVLA